MSEAQLKSAEHQGDSRYVVICRADEGHQAFPGILLQHSSTRKRPTDDTHARTLLGPMRVMRGKAMMELKISMKFMLSS